MSCHSNIIFTSYVPPLLSSLYLYSNTGYCILTPINLQYSCCDGVIFADQYIGLALIRMLFSWSSQFSIKRWNNSNATVCYFFLQDFTSLFLTGPSFLFVLTFNGSSVLWLKQPITVVKTDVLSYFLFIIRRKKNTGQRKFYQKSPSVTDLLVELTASSCLTNISSHRIFLLWDKCRL